MSQREKDLDTMRKELQRRLDEARKQRDGMELVSNDVCLSGRGGSSGTQMGARNIICDAMCCAGMYVCSLYFRFVGRID